MTQTCDYCGQTVVNCECNSLINPNHVSEDNITILSSHLAGLGYPVLDEELPF